MKSVVIYYSFKGHTKNAAVKLAADRDAELFEICEAKRRSFPAAVIPGCFDARKRRASAIHDIPADLNAFDRILIGAPIWGGYPAPAFNSLVHLLPEGKEVEVFLCSAGGSSALSAEGTRQLIRDRGCRLVEYHDIKTGQ